MSDETSKEPQEKKTKKKKSSKPADGKAKNGQETSAKDKSAEEQPPQEELKSPPEVENATADTKENNEHVNLEMNEPAPDIKTQETPSKEKITEPPESKTSPQESDKKDVIREMDLRKLQELKEAFSLFDINHDGFIDLEDLKYTFATLGKPDIPEEYLKQMLGESSEPVDFDAFVLLFGHKITELDSEDVFTGALATWDMEGSGYISEKRIKDDLRKFGDRFTPDEIDCALEEAPVYVQKGAPMIDYVQFGSNVCGLRNVEKSRQFQKIVESGET